MKADLPVDQTRVLQSAETSAAMKRKPAVAHADPSLRHRIPHTLERVDSLVRDGRPGCARTISLYAVC